MGWEGALLLGFLLLFSAWVSFPSDNQYSYIDSNGIKHYILTPKISAYDYAVENWTNVLFTRYEDPWTVQTDVTALVIAGLFVVLLMQQPVRLYLINRMQSLFNLIKFFHFNHFEGGTESVNVDFKEKHTQENFLSLNYLSFKKLKFKKSFSNKFLTIFFVFLLLSPFYSFEVFAPNTTNTNASSVDTTNVTSSETIQNNSTSKDSPENEDSQEKDHQKKIEKKTGEKAEDKAKEQTSKEISKKSKTKTENQVNATVTETHYNNTSTEMPANYTSAEAQKPAEMPANYTSAEITLSGSIFIDDSINATLPSESGSNQTSTQYEGNETSSEISQTGTSIESTTNYTSSESQTIDPSSDTSDDEVPQPVLQVDLISPDTVQAENMTAGNENTTNYLTVSNTELNQDLNQLTISVWVRPNYTNGSTELAVVGKENSFLLSINNIIPPKKTAIFSVFDGIAWSTVTGSTQIRQEEWTHLAAIVNGTEVSLYQNGVLQDTMTLNDVFAISDGNLNLVSADVAGSESDVIIGAYVETTRGKYKITKQFSGEIKNVLIYKNALSEEEIYNIFSTSTPTYNESATTEATVRELTTVRKKLVSRDEYETMYGNFSAKIDRHLLEIMMSTDPTSAAKRVGTSYQENRLPVYIYLDSEDSISRLPSNIAITGSDEKIAVAKLTLNEMIQLARLSSVMKISMPHWAVPHGHAVSEGVSFTNADNFHSAGIDGTGVTIAVIDIDFFPNNPEIQSNVISSTLFDSLGFCGGSISCGVAAGNSHGTAVAEIIVDMAPNVDLRLYTIVTSVDFNNAVQDAINKNVDIITASLGFLIEGGDGTTGFYRDGTSIVAKKVNQAKNNGILVTVSTGNSANSHWQGTYSVSPVTPGSIGFGELTSVFGMQSVMNFRPGASGVQRACLPVIDIGLPWVASWNAWSITTQDYALFLYDSNMVNLLDFSDIFQFPSGDNPIEFFGFNQHTAINACLVLASFSSTQNHFFHINGIGNLVDPSVSGAGRTGSIDTPADATGALGVGAIDQATDLLEGFSSGGPTDDNRNKPEICGPDNTLSHQAGLNPFFGTSASTPHVAGAAALLLDQNPGLSASQLQNDLINGARFNGAYSVNNLCGANSGALELPVAGPPPSPLCPLIPGCLTGNLYVVHAAGDIIRQYDSAGALLDANFITGLISANDIAFDSAGNLYVLDTGFQTVRQYNSAGALLDANFITGLSNPRSFAFDSAGNLYVSDNNFDTVRQYDSAGALLDANFITGLNIPISIAFDSAGNLYVLDAGFRTVRQYDSTGVLLDANFITGLSVGSALAIAFDSAGNLYVTDAALDTVRQYDSTGALLDANFITGLGRSFSIAFDSAGNLYAAEPDLGTVRQYDSAGALLDANFITGLSFPFAIAFNFTLSLPPTVTASDSPTISDNVTMSADVSEIDTPAVTDSVVIAHPPILVTDVPTVSDSVVITHVPISLTDAPTVSDTVTGMAMPSVGDTPSVTDRVTMSADILPTDVPTTTDNVAGMGMPSVLDAPTVSDSVTMSTDVSVIDAPSVSDSKTVVIMGKESVTDTPTVTDRVTMSADISAADSPTTSDNVAGMGMPSVLDAPTVSDSVTMSADISAADSPTTSDNVAGMGMPSVGDTPTVSDSVTMSADISAADSPTTSDNVAGMGMPSVGDAPSITDRVTMSADISAADSPTTSDNVAGMGMPSVGDAPSITDRVTMSADISAADSPTTSDNVAGMGMPSVGDAPTVSDSVTMSADISAADSPTTSDNVAGMGMPSVLDAPTVSDSVTMSADISVTDATTVSDNVVLTHPPISLTDTPAISDDTFVIPSDIDGDGIRNEIDAQPNTPSFDFTDIPGGGTTSGTITSLGDQTLSVTEEVNPDGVRITVISSSGPTSATVSVCGGITTLSFGAGDEAVVTCSSVTIKVIGGTVGIEFVATDGTTGTTTLSSGGIITFDPATFTITNDGTDPVTVLVDGEPITVEAGETFTLPTTTPQTPSELIDFIDELGLPSNVENNLRAPLKQAQDVLDDDNPKNDGAVCGKINAFINMVNAQEGKKLTSEQAEKLREAAQSVKESIGC